MIMKRIQKSSCYMNSNWLLAIVIMVLPIITAAQTQGKVTDATTHEPIVGASVKVRNTTQGTVTNENGEFSIEANEELEISYVGYQSLVLKPSGKFLQIQMEASAAQLSEVVVTAYNAKRPLNTVAAPITVLPKADLNRGDNATLIPILNAVPGLKLDYYTYGDYRLNIRGGALAQPSVHSSGYRMYWNDIPITSASGGNPLGGLDVNFINSLEIIKGPGSAMYGAGFGGTVLVTTDRATQNGTTINADVMAGGYETYRATTGVRSDWNQGNIAVQYTHLQSEGYRDMTDTRADIVNTFGQFYTGTKGTLSYLFNYENRNINIAGDLDEETFQKAPKTANTIQPTGFGPNKYTFGAGYNYWFNKNWNASIGAYYFDNEGEFVLSFPFFAIFDKEPSSGLNTRATITHKRNLGNTKLNVNVGAEYASTDNEGISYNGDFNTDTASITNINEAFTKQLLGFAQAEFIFPGDFYLTAGLSYNNYDYDVKSGTNTNQPLRYKTTVDKAVPRFSLLKKFGTYSAYVALGQGFNPPAAGIFNDFLNFDGSVNEDLQASTGWNFEIGSRGNTKNGLFFYDIAYYNLRVKDAIISRLFEISSGVNAERKTNAGEVQQIGIEALAGVNFATNPDNFWNGSQLRVGYTFNDYEYADYQTFRTEFDADFNSIFVPVDYSGKEIPGTIPSAFLVLLDIKTKPGFYLNYTFNSYDETFLTDANDSKADAYTLMNVRLGYNKTFVNGKFTLHPYIGVNNLGDTLYSSLTVYNSTFGGFFNPGYRRQFFGGLQVNWRL